MTLTLEVSVDGGTPRNVELASDLTPAETVEVVRLCGGSGPLTALARGEWNPTAAKAIVVVQLRREAMNVHMDTVTLEAGEEWTLPTYASFEATIPMSDA